MSETKIVLFAKRERPMTEAEREAERRFDSLVHSLNGFTRGEISEALFASYCDVADLLWIASRLNECLRLPPTA